MSKKNFFDRVQPTNGQKTSDYEGITYEFRYPLPSYASVDFRNSFFLVNDTINFGSNTDLLDTNIFISPNVDIIRANISPNSLYNPITREENHLWNGVSSFRVLINGQVVEETNNLVGQLDHIKKRLLYGNSNQSLKNYQNVFNTYRDRFYINGNTLSNRANQIETITYPDFSSVWTQDKPLGGGGILGIELTFRPDYYMTMLNQSWGYADNAYLAGTTATDNLLQLTPTQLKNSYVLNKLELYLNVLHNDFIPPVDTPLVYNQEKWKIYTQTLTNSTDQTFNFNLPKNIRAFGFAFQSNDVGKTANSGVEIWNLSGKPRYIERGTTDNIGLLQLDRERRNVQCNKLQDFRLEYGKNIYPYYQYNNQESANVDFTSRIIYERLLDSNKLKYKAGGFNKHDENFKYGQIYYCEFNDIDPSDQDVLRLQLKFSSAPSNLNLIYFYYQNSSLTCVYDFAQQITQVVADVI